MAALATAWEDDKHYSQGEEEPSVLQPCTSPLLSGQSADHRLATQKTAQFLREAERNRRQIEKLEKERTLISQCRKNGWADVSGEIEEYENVLEGQRNAEKINLQKQLMKIHNGVRKLQRHLTDVKPTPELIEKLKEIMSEVEISINSVKEEQRSRFEEFLKEEWTCRQEITAYEKKIENWSLAVKTNPKLPAAPTVRTKPPDRDLPAEVRALEVFLQKTGGSYGGWDQYDHEAFLKVWVKHSGEPGYRKEAKLYLPGRTMEEIEQHEEWHQELIYLQDRKKEAIQRWKASKHQEHQIRIQTQEKTEEAKRREKEAKSQAQQHRTEEERSEMARRLEEWREEKKRREEQEEEQRLAEEIQKRKREKEERRRQLEVKLTVEEQLRLRRVEEEEQERRRRAEEEREREERRKEATKSIRRFNERDLHRVEAKRHEKQLREKEQEERQRRLAAKLKEKVDNHVNRDPSRLTRPTKGWEERLKHVGPSGDGPMLQMFHRAVPTWRQGL
ncbi:coiled-coil domain-containing protein 112 isoform X1 [Astatotilapia calliptera]|uniref:coiled-coil domain-containing protein 112 isoform X1 n=1 Tax=Astatotilapia calliptera TaxID=8154 RepID=UPI000E404770|nr:coiled-coil domain-containing protein 112 isoform X1 [Astatotilapia calliptera]